ncbi:MAG: NPCBM/NEW2 domain-containing protein [Planctomycetes bacterium]|nr:NPCBM/NEW2 domain-containing protein [Planctomycetota bacterium]
MTRASIRGLPWVRAGLLCAVLGCVAIGAGAKPEPQVYTKAATWAETMAATRANYIQWAAKNNEAQDPSGFQPFDSGSMPGDGPARQVLVNVAGLKVLRLVATCEKGTANCNIWGEPKLVAADGKETPLGTLKPTSVSVGWGQMLLDKNWQDRPLRIGNREFKHGIWVHADSELVYALDGKYQRFEAWVGEDKDRANGVVRFEVLSGEAAQRPAWWTRMTEDFPRETGWLADDAGGGALQWFAPRTDTKYEQSLIQRVLGQLGAAAEGLQAQMQGLEQAAAPPGDPRWLNLYILACRARECATVIRRVGPESAPGLEKEWQGLVVARATLDDPRWADLEARAWRQRELESQYEALLHDLGNRAHFAKVAPEALRPEALILDSDRDPADVVLRRTSALLADLKRTSAAAKLADLEKSLEALKKLGAETPAASTDARRGLFFQACEVRRQIALANPLLDFDKILFIKRHRSIYNHMCDQYYGMAQKPGGGLYVLSGAFGPNPQVRDVLAASTVQNGRLKGQRLSGGPLRNWNIRFDGMGNQQGEPTEGGSFLSPDLSYDGREILFAYVECTGDTNHRHHTDPSQGHWAEGRCYHVFKVNADGTGLVQLTDGTWNEFDPCWLPNGRIAFISERRGGYLRCGRVCPTYTLYDMAADGRDINCLSFHETNEWNPSVTHDGRIIYTRWDYIDRFGCTAHHPWITTLDGADSRAVHGNFAPRNARPDMELDVRAIPHSNKYVATAAPHHSQAFGSLVVFNPDVPDDDGMRPIRRLTPEVGFPESQGGTETYGMAWPLSEDYYLCIYDSNMERQKQGQGVRGNYGIYLVDSFGNKELLYRDPEIACMSPMPLRPRPAPLVGPSPTQLAKNQSADRTPAYPGKPGEATIAVLNAYATLRPWPAGTKIAALRVLQVLPMSVPSGGPPHETGQRIAMAGDSVVPARYVLGTVPVEEDGSAHFTVPANREMFFQALDANGLAIQSMRSATYLHEGERLVCAGCHEPKDRAPSPMPAVPLAMRREPSKLQPDVDGSNPFSYPRLVQPVLDRNCVECHNKNAPKACNLAREPIQKKWYASYNSLVKYGFTSYGENLRTTPGQFGARASKLYEILSKGHYDVKLSPEDMHRLTLWLDLSTMFYGVYEKEGGEVQLGGGIARPTLE